MEIRALQHGLLTASLLCLLLAASASAAPVPPEIYMAGVNDSQWAFQGNRARCELSHEIPRFGTARFLRLAGEPLSFRIDSFQPVPEAVAGLLNEISPPWEAQRQADPLIQEVGLRVGLTPIQLKRRPAAWLLASLARGQIGSFAFFDWNDQRKKVYLRLSPVNFQQPYRAFKRCLKSLSAKGFQAYRESLVHFPLDVSKLGLPQRAFLRRLADYLLADDSIRGIEIDGHADDRGTRRYNDRLSARRAASVFDFLAAVGVKRSLMERRAFGESRPRLAGHSARARAANRRVEIHLRR